MTNNLISNILESRTKIKDVRINDLEKLSNLFPYCEVTKIIELNHRRTNHDIFFEKKLTEFIIHISDRSFLFSLLNKQKNKRNISIVKKKKSFNEWLIGKEIEKEEKVNEKTSLVNNESSDDLMTETLAKLYIEQKHFDQAIRAYEILSLKYPKKSSFFVREIEKIKKLILINDE